MARERFALYILVSKLFAAILLLLGNLSQHAATYVPLTKLTIFFVNYIATPCAFFSLVSNRLHIIALAANRAHAIWNTEGAAASASDKDSARITWTCFAIQSVALCQSAYNSALSVKWFNDFMLCDPIGKILQLIGKVWPFTTAQVAATAANDNALRITQTQNINSANRNANNVNGNANNVNVNVVGSNRRWALQRSFVK
ncbi:hypothetical protein GPALN_011550 [Globodera pallida]|nr:hypothetical protein GPALN_011550 [Globodera pallida]